jgi:hypothetical protein
MAPPPISDRTEELYNSLEQSPDGTVDMILERWEHIKSPTSARKVYGPADLYVKRQPDGSITMHVGLRGTRPARPRQQVRARKYALDRTAEFYARLAASVGVFEMEIEDGKSYREYIFAPIPPGTDPNNLPTRKLYGPAAITGHRFEDGTVTVEARFIGTEPRERIY